MEAPETFDPARYYLGRLCKRGHDWQATGKTLRRRCDRTCPACQLHRQRPVYHKRSAARYGGRFGIITNLKLERGCADCGYNAHPAALEFDHLPGAPKLFGISQMISFASDAELWAEIAKCEVVCANCHNIRTWQRRQTRRQSRGQLS